MILNQSMINEDIKSWEKLLSNGEWKIAVFSKKHRLTKYVHFKFIRDKNGFVISNLPLNLPIVCSGHYDYVIMVKDKYKIMIDKNEMLMDYSYFTKGTNFTIDSCDFRYGNLRKW